MKRSFLAFYFLLLLGLYCASVRASDVDTVYWENLRQENLAIFQLHTANLDSAEQASIALYSRLKEPIDSLVLSDIYSVSGNIYFAKGDYVKSLDYHTQALRLREALHLPAKIATTLSNIGNAYYYANNYAKALQALREGTRQLHKADAPKERFARHFNTIGLVYYDMDKIDSSLHYFNRALEVAVAGEESSSELADIYNNLGALFAYIDKDQLAIENYQKAVVINRSHNDLASVAWGFNKLGNAFLRQEQNEEAKAYFYRADSIARFASTFELRKDIAYSIFSYYLKVLSRDSALKYVRLYDRLSDSIVRYKTSKNIQEIATKYEVEKKEAALTLSKETLARLAAENKVQKSYLVLAILGLLALAVIFFFAYRSYRQNKALSQLSLQLKDQELKKLMADQESETFAAMLKGQEEERERIARDLHDRLGGTLAALKLSLGREENHIEKADLEIIDQAVGEVRAIAHNLSSGVLEKHGLNIAFQQLKETIERSGKMKFNLYLSQNMAELGQQVSLELYRIVQELTNNTIKHAEASEINLQTSQHDATFNLIFEDNGKGMNAQEVKKGMGMQNIQKRIAAIKGRLHLDTEPGRGTIIIIELDIPS
jgi:signal transduction histidine kinase